MTGKAETFIPRELTHCSTSFRDHNSPENREAPHAVPVAGPGDASLVSSQG